MKKFYLIALFAFVCNFASAQIERVTYRGAFAPAPAAMWTDTWTNWDPNSTDYTDEATVVNITTDIIANTTFVTGKTYKLTGLIYVRNNAILTIQAGVVIKGNTGSSLIITKGSKLNAIGTVGSPIVFTSSKAAGTRATGDWGGVVLLGNARTTAGDSGNTGINNIEGITPSTLTQFGGGTTPNDADSSGIMRYVRIEFCGAPFLPNNEINGLTMGAVGNGTVIDYVQVSFSNDDSFEWFGGSVNCKHLVAFRGLDDDFDTDNGYKGAVQFILGIKDPVVADNAASGSTSEGFEMDGNPAAKNAEAGWDNSTCVFTNATLIGPAQRALIAPTATVDTDHARGARLRRATQARIYNSIFLDFRNNFLFVDGGATSPSSLFNANAGTLKFQNNIIAGVALDATYTGGVNPTSLNSWFTSNNNSYVLNTGVLASPYNTANSADYNLNGTTIDYRPGALASIGASFTDATIAALSPINTTPSNPNKFDAVGYRGAFAPAPAAMWTDTWTNWNPNATEYANELNVVTINSNVTANTTWTAGTTYILSGLIYVTGDATLTIEPGVVVKGTLGSALIITRGSKLNAIGTVTQPIVFTSNVAAGSRATGDWGGIVLLGKARFTAGATGNTGVSNIEGITAAGISEFGGGLTPDDADNSGTLKYVRIEFGGSPLTPDNEINGLTMGAVGSGTTIDYVQCSFINDDSFEWFGGSVNCKHLVAFRGVDDDFDVDNGFKGIVQFALGIKDPAVADQISSSTSEGFEVDNNPAALTAETGWDNSSTIFSNCTLIGPSGRVGQTANTKHQRAARLRRGAEIKLFNSIFLDFKANYVHIDGAVAVANALAGTLKFQNNIIAGVADGTYTAGVRGASASDLTSWFTTNNNTYTTSAGILAKPYNTADYFDYNNNGTTVDYRPGVLASTGAKFDDASIVPFVNSFVPSVTNLTFCQGATGLTPLTAVTTENGVSLRWYTSAITATFTTTAPTPSSSAVGEKTYYVAEVTSFGTVSSRVALKVTILARPTVGLGAIKGVDALTAPTVNVGLYLGTTTAFTYSVNPIIVDPTITTYLWTVPSGVNIISGQGTNTVTVNYLNVAAGAGTVGTILAQGVNAAGCPGVASKLTIKKALATAPTLKMYDKNSAKPTTALTSFGQFAGTTTPVTLVSSTVATATGYKWELPAGVNLVFGGVTPVTTSATYTTEPFLNPVTISSALNTGTKFWTVTTNTYSNVNVNGVPTTIVVSTATQQVYGKSGYATSAAVPYLQYGTVITTVIPSIIVNFEGLTQQTDNALYLGVKSLNGVGASITNNAASTIATLVADIAANVPGVNYNVYTETLTPVIPTSTNGTSTYTLAGTTPSTAKLLKLVSVTPLAPISIKSLNGLVSTIDISTYVGTEKVLTLTAAAVANASSYTWTLPGGVDITGDSLGVTASSTTYTSVSNSISVNYVGVTQGTASVVIAVKANNNVGSSADKTLTLTAAAPATPSVRGTLAICPTAASNVVYTVPVIATRATSYLITPPTGASVNGGAIDAPVSIAATTGATFTVNYPSGFLSPSTAPLYLNIASVNGFGSNLLNRVLKLTNSTVGCPAPRFSDASVANAFSVVAYPNPSSSEFTIETSAKGAINAKVYDMQGRLVENANSTQVGSSLAPGVYNVIVSQGANTKSVRVIKK